MNKILEMREKRANLWDACKQFLNTHQNENGIMNAEDTATYERMEAELNDYGKAIDRMERAEVIDVEMNKPTSSPLTSRPDAQNAQKRGRASDEYKASFWNMMKARAGAVRPDVLDALEVGTDSEGGYLVPDEFEHTLVQAMQEENIFRRLAHVIHTSSGDRKIPVVSSHGDAEWTDEEASYHEADEAFSQVVIGAHKLTTSIKVSEELMNDSVFNMEAYIAQEFARRCGAKEEDAFFNGNGTGKPTGIFDSTNGGHVAVTTASATAITLDEVMDLYYGLRAPYRNRAAFITNDSTIKLLRKIKDGNGQYIWQPALTGGTPDMIMNRPVYTSSYVPDATAGHTSMAFGDFSYYWIADRQGRTFRRLNELYATTGQVGFLASQRVDGKLVLTEAVQILKQHA